MLSGPQSPETQVKKKKLSPFYVYDLRSGKIDEQTAKNE